MNAHAKREYTRHDTPVVRIKTSSSRGLVSGLHGILNISALSLINAREIVFDRRGMKIRPAGIDDKSVLRISAAGGFSFGRTRGINDGDIIGLYDIEQDGDFFYLSKRSEQ